MNTTADTVDPAVAQLRLVTKTADHVEMAIPATNYRLRLACTTAIDKPEGKRVPGAIRCNAWKVDIVSVGGDYVEPVYGKPRRVQGHVIAKTSNGIVVRVCGTPFCGTLTEHCKIKAADIPVGARVGMDITGQPTFEPK